MTGIALDEGLGLAVDEQEATLFEAAEGDEAVEEGEGDLLEVCGLERLLPGDPRLAPGLEDREHDVAGVRARRPRGSDPRAAGSPARRSTPSAASCRRASSWRPTRSSVIRAARTVRTGLGMPQVESVDMVRCVRTVLPWRIRALDLVLLGLSNASSTDASSAKALPMIREVSTRC